MKNMNSFPTCVDELIGKQLALRLKYRLQYRQCSVVDVNIDFQKIDVESLFSSSGFFYID